MNDTRVILPGLTTLKQEHVNNTKVYANRIEALNHWPKNSIVAEIGVGFGNHTDAILSIVNPERYDGFDLFVLDKGEPYYGPSLAEILQGKTHYQFYIDKYHDEISSGKIKIYYGNSSVEIQKISNSMYDVVYIDGDHSILAVYQDTKASIPKLKENGLLVFNDYVRFDEDRQPYGIIEVVNDLCNNHNWIVEYFAFQNLMYCDIALKRKT